MKSFPARLLGLLMLFGLLVVGVVACDDDNNPLGNGNDVAQVIISGASADTLAVGDSLRLTVTVIDQDGDTLSSQTISYTSTSTAVASVSAVGTIRAVAAGAATITATVDGVSDTIVITVEGAAPVAADVTIAPGDTAFAFNDSLGFTATVTDASGDTIVGAPVTFTSSDTTVARVSSTGRVTGRAAGDVNIIATSGVFADTVAVRLFTPSSTNIGSLVLTPAVLTLAVGADSTLTVAVTDTLGAAVTNPNVQFISTTPATASVSTQGNVIALLAGTTNIIATFGARADTTAVTVN